MKKPTTLITLLLLVCIVLLAFWAVSSMEVRDTNPPAFTMPGHSIVISSGNITGLEPSRGIYDCCA